MIRLTGGTLRGRVLRAAVPDGVRPTSSRTREALFNLLGQDLEGLSWLDLTGGYGLVALEAWSRGASPVTVVERAGPVAAVLRRNAAELGVKLDLRVADSLRIRLEPTDIVFADPPYREVVAQAGEGMARWVARAVSLARRTAVIEGPAGAPWPAEGQLDRRVYGDTELVFYAGAAPAAPGEPAAGPPS